MTADRADAVSARLAAHHLDRPVEGLEELDLLLCGAQDAGAGTATLGVALRSSVDAVLAGLAADDLVELMSLRGVPHLHRRTDVDVVRAAMTTSDPRDLEAVCGPLAVPALEGDDPVGEVAVAMTAVMDATAGGPTTKSDLSTAITPHLRPGLLQDCPGCGVHHAIDGLFRLGTLRAGLGLVPEATTQTFVRIAGVPTARPTDREVATARARMAAVASQVAAPLDRAQVATWFGWSERSVVAASADVAPTDGAADAGSARGTRSRRRAAGTRHARLVPARDPWLRGTDRAWLLGDHADRRAEVFRAIGAPGVILVDGEIVGTWRQRTAGRALSVELAAWRTLAIDERDELTTDAEMLGRLRDRPVRFSITGP